MAKKIKLSLLLLFIFLVATACSGQKEAERIPQILDVQLSVLPEHGNVNDPVTISAEVLYGDKQVTDADDVEFEIWRANDENHEVIPVEHTGNGIYKLEKTFSTEGTYYVYAHVSAEGMHAMPKKEFVIGQASEPETDSSSTEMNNHNVTDENNEQ